MTHNQIAGWVILGTLFLIFVVPIIPAMRADIHARLFTYGSWMIGITIAMVMSFLAGASILMIRGVIV